jgi:hypothetical protein
MVHQSIGYKDKDLDLISLILSSLNQLPHHSIGYIGSSHDLDLIGCTESHDISYQPLDLVVFSSPASALKVFYSLITKCESLLMSCGGSLKT